MGSLQCALPDAPSVMYDSNLGKWRVWWCGGALGDNIFYAEGDAPTAPTSLGCAPSGGSVRRRDSVRTSSSPAAALGTLFRSS
jgi:hypothetical protein